MSTPDTQTCPIQDHADGCAHPIHTPDRDPERPYFPDVEVQLSGEDGGPLQMIGRVGRALRHTATPDQIALFRKEATSGDYDNVIQTCMRWVDVS